MKHMNNRQTDKQSITINQRKDFNSMTRIFAGTILTLGMVTSTVTTTITAFAASHMRPSSVSVSGAAPQTSSHSIAGLLHAVNGFGYAATHGPDSAINSYATQALLAQAHSGHLVNLLGPAQNPPPRYTFTLDAFNDSSATVTMRFRYNPSTTLTDRMTWVVTQTGWKISNIQYIPDTTGVRILLFAATDSFSWAVVHGTDARINSFATPDLLRRAPSRHLVNLFGLMNTPQHVVVQNVRLRGHTASGEVVFIFNPREHVTRTSVWTYTRAGWKLAAIGKYGRG